MGDMADFTIEQGMAEEEYRLDNPYEFEDENCDIPPSGKRYKTCRCCKQGGLVWMMVKSKWLLHEQDGKIHACKK